MTVLPFLLVLSILTAFLLFPASASDSDDEAAAESAAAQFVKKAIDSHTVVIFSKSYCPYCRRAKGVFHSLEQEVHVIELDERAGGWRIQNAVSRISGRRTVPQVFIDGKHLGGSDDTVEAYESGKLAKLLGITTSGKADL